jgi:CNT family concentrative nucleoside transporter
MQNLTGILGIILILGVAYLLSNNKKAIDYRLVFSGIGLQIFLGLLILKVAPVTRFFGFLGHCMDKLGGLAKEGANFVYGGISMTGYTGAPQDFRAPTSFVFAFNIPATIILVCVLVAIFYHIGLMQRVIAVIAKVMNKVMRVSGAEALSNVASAFVGQVEAQVMIRPYIATMTNSELLASMSGSMACIAGSILIVYVSMGVPAAYLLTASLMAAPGALVISKIIYPETEESQTKGDIKLEVKSPYTNIIDAISHGASDGMKIAINVIAMLIGFIALIALINFILGLIYPGFSLDVILGWIFYPFAWAMGVPQQDVLEVATLMGKKLSINEFVAYSDLTRMNATAATALTSKATMVASFALCGFANFSSVGMQIGGISELAPSRRADLAKLGFKALIAGTLASYLSATIAGLLFDVIPTIDPSTWF